MRLRDVPVVEQVMEAGAPDRVFDTLLLLGPVVVAIVALAGRSAVTVGVVSAYLVFFASYVLYKGLRR